MPIEPHKAHILKTLGEPISNAIIAHVMLFAITIVSLFVLGVIL